MPDTAAPPAATAPLDRTRIPEPPEPAPDLNTLRLVRDDAAERAAALLAGHRPTHPDPVIDMIRLLSHGGPWQVTGGALERAELSPGQLRRLRVAYTRGRAAGGALSGESFVHTALHATEPDPAVLERALAEVTAYAGAARASVRAEANRITVAERGIQIRFGPDERWHPYTRVADDWAPAPGSDPGPAAAFAAALNARSARS